MAWGRGWKEWTGRVRESLQDEGETYTGKRWINQVADSRAQK